MSTNQDHKAKESKALKALLRLMDEETLGFILCNDTHGLSHEVRTLIEARSDTPEKEAFFSSEDGQNLFDLTLKEYFMGEKSEWNRRNLKTFLSSHEEAILNQTVGAQFVKDKLHGTERYTTQRADSDELLKLPEVQDAFTGATKDYLDAHAAETARQAEFKAMQESRKQFEPRLQRFKAAFHPAYSTIEKTPLPQQAPEKTVHTGKACEHEPVHSGMILTDIGKSAANAVG